MNENATPSGSLYCRPALTRSVVCSKTQSTISVPDLVIKTSLPAISSYSALLWKLGLSKPPSERRSPFIVFHSAILVHVKSSAFAASASSQLRPEKAAEKTDRAPLQRKDKQIDKVLLAGKMPSSSLRCTNTFGPSQADISRNI